MKIRAAIMALLLLATAGCAPDPERVREQARQPGGPPTLELPRPMALKVFAPEHCSQANGVFDVAIPIHWDDPDPARPTFRYSFQIRLAEGVDYRYAPVVIVLNGGPGSPAIHASGAKPPLAAVPKFFNAIYTDVRGTGCNSTLDDGTQFPDSAYWGDYYAKDVLSLVVGLKLSRYFVFGLSYGTVHATLMTKLAQNLGLPLPQAVVLEGTFGRHITAAKWIQGWQDEWAEMKPSLPASVVAALSTSPLPLGYTSVQWHHLLGNGLKLATISRTGNALQNLLTAWGSADPVVSSAAEAYLRAGIEANTMTMLPRVELATWCRELFDDGVYARDLVGGAIVPTGADICAQLGFRAERLYDAADYPLTVPIYYFQGNDDPTTTSENAYYHFANQRQANRLYIEVEGAGHGPISMTLASFGCTDAVWTAIAAFPLSIGSALQKCSWPIRIEARLKGT
jgi:proline iminopeptidase